MSDVSSMFDATRCLSTEEPVSTVKVSDVSGLFDATRSVSSEEPVSIVKECQK